MASKKDRKKLASELALAAFKKKHEGKDLTDAQEKEFADLQTAVRTERFKVNGAKYVETALNALAKVAKLGNKKKFAYDAKQVETIGNALTSAMNEIKNAFEGGKAKAKIEL